MNDLTHLFSQRIPWDRGFLQPVTDRIEYERKSPVAREAQAPGSDSFVSDGESQKQLLDPPESSR